MFKEKNLTYYAYNATYQNKSANKEKTLNFTNLQKGFYDDIILTESNIKHSRKSLEDIKEKSIKQSVYSNRNIPSTWKTKLNYRDEVCKSIQNDSTFAKFLGKKENEDENEKKINKFLGITTNPHMKTQSTLSLNETSSLPEIEKSKTETSKLSEFNNRKTVKKVSYLMSSMAIHNNGVHIMSEKEIASKLDDYKSKYDMNKFIETLRNKMEKEDKIYSTTEMNETSKTLNTTSRRKNNKPKVLQSSIYINLIPKEKEEKRVNTASNVEQKETQFLNVAGEEKIEITNPKIKRELEIIDYYGPRYSYCKICNNKNLEFYQNFETNQCLKLLSYLKKERLAKKKEFKAPKLLK